MLIPTLAYLRLLAAAQDLNAGGGSLTGPLVGRKIALFNALAHPASPASVWADLTESTYTGYARQSVTWTGPYDTAGSSALVGNSTTWSPTDSASPQAIMGYAIVTTDSTPVLLALEVFPAPLPFNGPTDGFVLVPQAGPIDLTNLGSAAVIS